jgi:hypothetical protein
LGKSNASALPENPWRSHFGEMQHLCIDRNSLAMSFWVKAANKRIIHLIYLN